MSKEEKKPTMYLVFDTNARAGQPRNHEIIVRTYPDGREPDIKSYALSSDKPTEMPMEHAFKFLVDPAFRVTRQDGQIIAPPPKAATTVVATEIPIDQTIAAYAELTRVALYKRCKMQPGGEDIDEKTSAQDMIDFLIECRRKQARAMQGADDGEVAAKMASGDLGGAATDEELNRMFGESSMVAGQAA